MIAPAHAASARDSLGERLRSAPDGDKQTSHQSCCTMTPRAQTPVKQAPRLQGSAPAACCLGWPKRDWSQQCRSIARCIRGTARLSPPSHCMSRQPVAAQNSVSDPRPCSNVLVRKAARESDWARQPDDCLSLARCNCADHANTRGCCKGTQILQRLFRAVESVQVTACQQLRVLQ